MQEQTLIDKALDTYPNLFDRLESIITPERGFDVFKNIADTYAPSLTVRYTRGPVVKKLLEAAQTQGICSDNLTFHGNYLKSGNVALEFGRAVRKPVWSMAHMDNISFLTADRAGHSYQVVPYCDPRQSSGVREALALAFSPETGTMEQIATGHLRSDDDGLTNYFETDANNLAPATRIVYASRAEWDQDSGTVYGNVDDAFGCAALVLCALVLSHYQAEALIVLTDEEEGAVAVGNRAFSRGSMRLINRIAPEQSPDLITITDLHEEVSDIFEAEKSQSEAAGPPNTQRGSSHFSDARFGQGALFAGFASKAKGGVTPPQLLAFQRELAQYLTGHGIELKENPGYVSRSDCVSAMMATPNVSLIGYPGAFSHFVDTPRAHINDLLHLAKAMTIYLLVAQNQAWRERYLF